MRVSYFTIRCAQAFAAAVIVCAAGSAFALETNSLRLSQDISAEYRAIIITDDDAISAGPMDFASLFNAVSAGLGERVAIDAMFLISNAVVISSEVGFEHGGTPYADEDLVAFDPVLGVCAMYLDGSSVGIPESADIDAASTDLSKPGAVYLSFDTTVELPVIGTVQDEDLAILDGGLFVAVIRGSNLGIPANADINALYVDETNAYFSLDITATIGSDTAGDDAIWVVDKATSNIVLLGSAFLAEAADLVALDAPEDEDGDWLCDFEEGTGQDDPATLFPGTSIPLDPSGNRTRADVADTDADGANDGAEAISETDPTDPGSVLALASLERSGSDMLVTWHTVSDKEYAIENTTDLDAGFTNEVAAPLTGAAGTNLTTYVHVGGASRKKLHYRARLIP